jgi:hypothetical protein
LNELGALAIDQFFGEKVGTGTEVTTCRRQPESSIGDGLNFSLQDMEARRNDLVHRLPEAQRITHESFHKRSSNVYGTPALVRRLLVDEASGYWPRYVVAFALMAVAATGTALSAYLLGTLTNEAYVHRNFQRIVIIGIITIAILRPKV